eukprot:g2906.t1
MAEDEHKGSGSERVAEDEHKGSGSERVSGRITKLLRFPSARVGSGGLRSTSEEFFNHVRGHMEQVDKFGRAWLQLTGDVNPADFGFNEESKDYEFDNTIEELADGEKRICHDMRQGHVTEGREVHDINELYNAAKVARPTFEAIFEQARLKFDDQERLVADVADLKKSERVEEKVRDSYQGKYWRTCDINRGRFVCKTLDQAAKVAVWLKETFNVVRSKNRFGKPSPDGNRFLLLNIRLRCQDTFWHLCEVQVRIQAIQQHEESGNGHEHYKYFRTFFAGATERRTELVQALRDIYKEDKRRRSSPPGSADTALRVDNKFVQTLMKQSNPLRLQRLADLFTTKLGEYEQAQQLLERAVEIAQEAVDGATHTDSKAAKLELAERQQQLADVLMEWGGQHQLERAASLLEDALSKTRSAVQDSGGHSSAAQQSCQQSSESCQQLSEEIAVILDRMGQVLTQQCRYNEAEIKYREAGEYFEENSEGRANNLGNLAIALIEQA